MQRDDISTSKHRESVFEYYQLTFTVGTCLPSCRYNYSMSGGQNIEL